MTTEKSAVTVTGTGFNRARPSGRRCSVSHRAARGQHPNRQRLASGHHYIRHVHRATIPVRWSSDSVIVPVSGAPSYNLTVVGGSGSGSYAAGHCRKHYRQCGAHGRIVHELDRGQRGQLDRPDHHDHDAGVQHRGHGELRRGAHYFAAVRDPPAWRDAAVFGEQRDRVERGFRSVTSAGLYTAPASMPTSGTDTVTATGPGGAGTAIVTLSYPAPTILSLNPTALPLGSLRRRSLVPVSHHSPPRRWALRRSSSRLRRRRRSPCRDSLRPPAWSTWLCRTDLRRRRLWRCRLAIPTRRYRPPRRDVSSSRPLSDPRPRTPRMSRLWDFKAG